jgi:hypothetical protein
VDEYACVTVASRANEPAEEFSRRLIDFWTAMLRHRPEDYLRVYAESTEFESDGGRLRRQYLIGVDVAEEIERELAAAGIHCEPVDRDDLYSKYEASGPHWFQIPH